MGSNPREDAKPLEEKGAETGEGSASGGVGVCMNNVLVQCFYMLTVFL